VVVATIRALKMHGGVKKDDLKKEDLKALETGMSNLQRHVENLQKFGIPAVVSINRFSADTDCRDRHGEGQVQGARRRGADGRSLGDGRRRRGRLSPRRW
jgi:formyltetrahydrofolate synthetase